MRCQIEKVLDSSLSDHMLVTVLTLHLSIALLTSSKRIVEQETDHVNLNTSTRPWFHKQYLWDNIDDLTKTAAETPVQVYSGSHMTGTLGVLYRGFTEITLHDHGAFVFSSSSSKWSQVIANGHSRKQKVTLRYHQLYTKGDGKVLLLQNTWDFKSTYVPHGDWGVFLASTLAQAGVLKNLHFSLYTEKKTFADWYGQSIVQVKTGDAKQAKDDPISLLCNDTRAVEMKKIVIPVQYDSSMAGRALTETASDTRIAEEVVKSEPSSDKNSLISKVARLMSYRKGVLYFKFMCEKGKVQMLKSSLLLKHHTAKTYDVDKNEEKLTFQTGPSLSLLQESE